MRWFLDCSLVMESPLDWLMIVSTRIVCSEWEVRGLKYNWCDRPSEVASAENGKEWVPNEECCDWECWLYCWLTNRRKCGYSTFFLHTLLWRKRVICEEWGLVVMVINRFSRYGNTSKEIYERIHVTLYWLVEDVMWFWLLIAAAWFIFQFSFPTIVYSLNY